MWNLFGGPKADEGSMRAHISALSDPLATKRAAAAKFLGRVGTAEALPSLLNQRDRLAVEMEGLTTSAAASICKRTLGKVLAAVPHQAWDSRWKFAQALRALGLSNLPGLLNKLEEGSTAESWCAAWLLGLMAEPTAIPGLRCLLRGSEVKGRQMASSAFWYMRHDVVTSATVPELVGILSDLQEDEAVRSSVAEILGCPGDKKAIDALLQVLKDPSAAVRASAACSLGSAKDVSVVPHLVEAIGDSSAVVRHDAVNAIHDLNSEAGLSGLVIALLDEDESVRYRAAYAIGEMCEMSETPELYEPAVPNLVEAIGKETDGPARYFEVFALSMVGWRSDSALAALVELLEVPRRAVRVAVANELSRIDLARARPQLAEMASAGDSDLKEFVLALLNGTYKEQKD